jgi:hypothetical protein
MVRNGYYKRFVISEQGFLNRVQVQRVRCRGCNASHSLLYDFLIPYRRHSLKALRSAVTMYLEQESSYFEVVSDEVDGAATVFGAVEHMVEHLTVFWMRVMQVLVSSGKAVAEVLRDPQVCPNSFKCKSLKKRAMLDVAATLLKLKPDIFEQANREGYPLFASGRGCALLRTHSTECALF